MKVFVGTAANNAHMHQIGRAIGDAGALGLYMLPFGGWPLGGPILFRSRAPAGIPREKLMHFPLWEITRVAAAKLGGSETLVDEIWERGELAFDRACSKRVLSGTPDVYLGVEHAALSALRAAKQVGATAGLVFPSVHHKFREKWLAPELAKFPELLERSTAAIRMRDATRDARRDEEMGAADFLHANSETTALSLIEAGFPKERILTVPLGSPPVAGGRPMPKHPTVLFAGNVAPHKGAHILLEAWKLSRGGSTGKLALYGTWALPRRMLPSEKDGVLVQGRVSGSTLRQAMREASVLVLPSICDGFGMVVSEAMAQGLPVICSSNTGASQLVVDGQNGFIVPPADKARLAERLDWCLKNPDELFAMGQRALATASNWSWAHFRERFASGLLEIAARTRERRPAQ